ncbi:beta-1,3-glucosyltransferase-like [Gigantopelta aegis]|uniref:beta-1,3-glucosyltransferase-like n=1 Tax=Gigantopelta aegis TaxID=1735272 RepID=UPI001B88D77D|nr:beta-1,3-glucosyltransferase-like [Gigantopelta aegis]
MLQKIMKEREVKFKDVVFIVLSQSNSYHVKRADLFQKHFTEQLQDVPQSDHPLLFFLHKQWPEGGAYTLFPLMEGFAANFSNKAWIFVCEEETRINLAGLITVLSSFDYHEQIFLGKPLRDYSSSIIHHYAFYDNPSRFLYPDPAGGFALTLPLIKSIVARLKSSKLEIDFVIDPKHELAKFIRNEDEGTPLTAVREFCTSVTSDKCVTSLPLRFPQCGTPLPVDDLFVAVKTCGKFHKDRVSVVKKTWGQETTNIEYYSDKEDPDIPTIDLGIENTESGHCEKTLAIIRRAANNSDEPWLLIADDDTIISLKQLRKLLACYDAKEVVVMGERYGYGVAKGYGYNYITGGGGMVFSKPAVKLLAEECKCPAIDSPDDMILGMCLDRLQIDLVHSQYIHQARIEDYSPDYLSYRDHVSFHKHYLIDPIQVYKMLDKVDLGLKSPHDEL